MNQEGNDNDFTEVISHYIQRSGYRLALLARLAGVPQMTLVNWHEGHVKRPRVWQDIVKVAQGMHLNKPEVNHLLTAAHYPTIEHLGYQVSSEGDQQLLTFWRESQTIHQKAPFQTIPDLPTFVGRKHLLALFSKLLQREYHASPYLLSGAGGVGKTVLTVRSAYLLRAHFSDGVLWARLDVSEPMAILRLFAAAYGVDVSMYEDLGSRSAAVRELLAHKRALLILDNAQSSQQITPLLPPSGTCAVIVTSRRRDLAIAQAEHRFHIQAFTPEETIALFIKVLGHEAITREKDAYTKIGELLGHLPLAIDIVACRLAIEPGWTATTFLESLRDEEALLGALKHEERAVRVAFETTFALLPPALQLFWAGLGRINQAEFDVATAAATTNISPEVARDYLRELFCLSLIRRGRPAHYRLTPLLQTFAKERALVHPQPG